MFCFRREALKEFCPVPDDLSPLALAPPEFSSVSGVSDLTSSPYPSDGDGSFNDADILTSGHDSSDILQFGKTSSYKLSFV